MVALQILHRAANLIGIVNQHFMLKQLTFNNRSTGPLVSRMLEPELNLYCAFEVRSLHNG